MSEDNNTEAATDPAGRIDGLVSVLPPCPYCGGPPVPVVVKAAFLGGGCFDWEEIHPEGIDAEGYVFCHECGADGPKSELLVFDKADCEQLMNDGVDLWVNRDTRHSDLYEVERATYRKVAH